MDHTILHDGMLRKTSHIQGWLDALHQLGTFYWRDRNSTIVKSLPPLLGALEWQGDARALSDALPHGHGAFGSVDLINSMAVLGYQAQRCQGDASKLDAIDLPALFFAKGRTEPYVLCARNEGLLQAYDTQRESMVELPDATLVGEYYRFEPASKPDESLEHSRHWFRDVGRRFTPLFWHVGIVSVLIHFTTLFVPFYVMLVYDKVIAARALDTLGFLAGGVIIALVFEMLLRSARTRMLAWFGARVSVIVNAAMFERLLFLPPSQAEQAPLSAQLARIKAFESVRDFFTGQMFQTLLEFPFTLILIVAIACIAGPVAWVPTAVIAAFVVLAFALKPRWQKQAGAAAHTASERQQLTIETISKLGLLRQVGMGRSWRSRLETASLKATRAQTEFAHTTALMEHLSYLCIVLAGVATILFSIERIWAGDMTPGALVATMIITWRVLYPLQIGCNMMPNLEQVRQSIDQVNQLMLLKPEVLNTRGHVSAGNFKGHVVFTQVGMRYGKRIDPVFTGINFELKPGEQLAIIGANGTGKTSILKLAAGLYLPHAGTVRIDGVDVRQTDGAWARRHVSYLPQSVDFMQGSIAENLRMHAPLATDEMLRDALIRADALTDVLRLPDGLQTRFGPEQFQLPSALLARLSLARFYVALQPILIIDELPYTLLNSKTGQNFREFLHEVKGKHTVLFVTHREDFASTADKLLLLQQDKRSFVTTPVQLNAMEQAS